MLGSVFVMGLPEEAGPVREGKILDAFRAGYGRPVRWVPIVSHVGGLQATILVAEDVLAIGDEGDDWVRVAVNATTAQGLADHYGALLPTSRISDLAWQQAAVRLVPHPQTPNPREMMRTSR